jgi:nucleoside-diphosphate-sugar epimerase
MKALVTGGGGFLGRYIVEKLRARGDEVRVISRGTYPELEALGCECVQGDLRSSQAVDLACEGIDVIFHVAAMAAMWGDREEIFGINVKGTANLIEAARERGVGRFVYTSSPSVVFGMDDLEGVDESTPYPDRYYAVYPESKARAEQLVLAANGEGISTCSLRPHLIWGPRDTHIVAMLVQRARQGRLVQIGDGNNRVDVSYVGNAADAHLQAADALAPDSAVAGQAYFIGDREPVNLWDWVRELLTRLGEPTPSKAISHRTAHMIGAVMEAAYSVLPLRGEPRLTRFLAAQFATSHYFDHSKAARDFGYEPAVDNEEGLRRTVEWWQELHSA